VLLLFTVCYVGWRSGKPEGPGGAVAPAPPADVAVSAITSLTFEQASPARLAGVIRGTGAIENGVRHIRDPTWPLITLEIIPG
jgi:hypothetical protein